MPIFEIAQSSLKRSNKDLAKKCSSDIKNGRVIFMSGIEQKYEDLLSLYKLRLRNAQTNNSSFSAEEIQSWSVAIEDLEESHVERLSMCVVQSEDYMYYIFINPLNTLLLAIFGGYSRSTIEKSINQNEENFIKGLTVSSKVYNYGELIHEWT